jgi:hypothetical protein
MKNDKKIYLSSKAKHKIELIYLNPESKYLISG